jgi:hypothetical protein
MDPLVTLLLLERGIHQGYDSHYDFLLECDEGSSNFRIILKSNLKDLPQIQVKPPQIQGSFSNLMVHFLLPWNSGEQGQSPIRLNLGKLQLVYHSSSSSYNVQV